MNEINQDNGVIDVSMKPAKKEKKQYSTQEFILKSKEYLFDVYAADATNVVVEEYIVDERWSTTDVQLSFDLTRMQATATESNTEPIIVRTRKIMVMETRTARFLSMVNVKEK